jgi:hypothetical protein
LKVRKEAVSKVKRRLFSFSRLIIAIFGQEK